MATDMAKTPEKGGGLADDLGALLQAGNGTDVTLVVGGSRLPAHRALLTARSLVFAAMLRHDTKEARDGCVNIKDLEEEVAKELLNFIYTDQSPLLGKMTSNLLIAADMYDIPVLKDKCEKMMEKEININNAAVTAVLALTYSCKRLTDSVIKFIKSHTEVMGTDGWAEALKDHTLVSVEICRLLAAKTGNSTQAQGTESKDEWQRGSLAGDLRALLQSGEAADVTLITGGSKLPVHKAVIAARSSVLADMLQSARDGSLNIAEFNEDVLKQVLCFIYTDQAPLLEKMADQLLVAAQKYNLPLLKQLCEDQLVQDITVQNAAAAAVLAITTDTCSEFKTSAYDFMRIHYNKILGTDGWEAAIRNNPDAAVKLCRFIAATTCTRTASEPLRAERLHEASESGSVGKVRALLALGASVNSRDSRGRTALHRATLAGRKDTMRCLLRAGANVHAKIDQPGLTHEPDVYVSSRDMSRMSMNSPIGYGVSTWCHPRQMLRHGSANGGHSEVVRVLLASGADMEVQDNFGSTALHRAAQSGSADTVRCLLRAGANVHAKVIDRGQSRDETMNYYNYSPPMKNSCLYNRDMRRSYHHMWDSFSDMTMNVMDRTGVRPQPGWTALHWAAAEGHTAVVMALLEGGADKSTTDSSGKTAIEVARQYNRQQIIEILK